MDSTILPTYHPPTTTPFQARDIVYRIIKELDPKLVLVALEPLTTLAKIDIKTAWKLKFTNPTESYVYNKENNKYYLISNVLLGYVLATTHLLPGEEGGRGSQNTLTVKWEDLRQTNCETIFTTSPDPTSLLGLHQIIIVEPEIFLATHGKKPAPGIQKDIIYSR